MRSFYSVLPVLLFLCRSGFPGEIKLGPPVDLTNAGVRLRLPVDGEFHPGIHPELLSHKFARERRWRRVSLIATPAAARPGDKRLSPGEYQRGTLRVVRRDLSSEGNDLTITERHPVTVAGAAGAKALATITRKDGVAQTVALVTWPVTLSRKGRSSLPLLYTLKIDSSAPPDQTGALRDAMLRHIAHIPPVPPEEAALPKLGSPMVLASRGLSLAFPLGWSLRRDGASPTQDRLELTCVGVDYLTLLPAAGFLLEVRRNRADRELVENPQRLEEFISAVRQEAAAQGASLESHRRFNLKDDPSLELVKRFRNSFDERVEVTWMIHHGKDLLAVRMDQRGKDADGARKKLETLLEELRFLEKGKDQLPPPVGPKKEKKKERAF